MALGLILFSFLLVFCLSLLVPAWVVDEHVIEHLQLLPLVAGIFLVGPLVYRWPRDLGLKRQAFWGAVLIAAMIAGLGREISFGRIYGLSPEAVSATKIIFAVSFAPFLALHFARHVNLSGPFGVHRIGQASLLVVLCGTLFFTGDIFERHIFDIAWNKNLEESFETAAYTALAMAAWRVRMPETFRGGTR